MGEFKKRRDYILQRFAAIPGVTCYKPEGAFYVFPNVSQYIGKKFEGNSLTTDNALADYLLESHKVAVVAGSGFGAPGYIRLSYANSMKNIEQGLDRIEQGFKKLS